MDQEEFNRIISYIVEQGVDLKNKYVQEKNLDIDYICIFAQSEGEYKKLLERASFTGEIVQETKTGPVFKFYKNPETIAGKPKVLKIRIPDKTRPQKGDVDFNTNYLEFKNKYSNQRKFSLIEREVFEMIELRDDKYDVLVYFSNVPPSKQLGII
jgi:hypothetical protein